MSNLKVKKRDVTKKSLSRETKNNGRKTAPQNHVFLTLRVPVGCGHIGCLESLCYVKLVLAGVDCFRDKS